MKPLFVCLFLGLALAAAGAGPAQRIVSAGGTVTEILYALGEDRRLAAVDSSSLFPAEARRLPQIGYVRQLSAEGVLSLNPDLLLTTADAGPPAVLEQIRGAGVRVAVVPPGTSWQAAGDRIRFVADLLGVADRGDAVAGELEAARKRLEARPAGRSPRVLFVYARGAGTLQVSGTGTEADAMIRLAGGTNAVTGYQGYRPLTAEALAAAAPEVLLLTTRGLESLGGAAGLARTPGLAAGVAGPLPRVVALDDLLLLGFGPRLGTAVETLSQAFGR